MKRTLIALAAATLATLTAAQTLDPLVDYRYTGQVPRNEDGTIRRSSRVLAAFRSLYPCPSTGSTLGACPGWAIDHVLPLACGGADAVFNLQWLPHEIKRAAGEFSKDSFERRIYGGHAMSKGCP